MTKITVIDAICGSGKTSYAIQMMNEEAKKPFKKKFIFVTPYLLEVDRIKESTIDDYFDPQSAYEKGKLNHFESLIKQGKNIVTTHALFALLDNQALQLIKSHGYVLILDEVANVIEQAKIVSSDLKILLESKTIEIDESKRVHWKAEEYSSRDSLFRFNDIKRLAEKGDLYIFNNSAVFWTMDVQSFLAFEEVYILTYLFDGQIQKYYYNMKNVSYEKKSVKYSPLKKEYKLVDYNPELDERTDIKSLLSIFENQITTGRGRNIEFNTNYNIRQKADRYLLSSSWFNNATDEEITRLKNNLRSYFETYTKTNVNNLFWSSLKSQAPKLKNRNVKYNLKDNREKDNYVALNVRATNNYKNCTSCAYVYNRFMNPIEKHFFESFGVKVNEDLLAVSDLIQFLFRGCIRNGDQMNIYIPAPRMRNLLKDWLDYKI